MADVIILSTADWDHPLWTNKQHTALALAAAGHRVLYVESLGLRAPRAGRRDLKRIARRLLRMFSLPSLVAPRVWCGRLRFGQVGRWDGLWRSTVIFCGEALNGWLGGWISSTGSSGLTTP